MTTVTLSPLTDEQAEALSWLIEAPQGELHWDDSAFRLQLDCFGHDSEDEDLLAAALKQARQVLRDRRAAHGILGRFVDLMLPNAAIGEAIGLPKSTVQAIACGRMVERFRHDTRDKLRELLRNHITVCQECLDDLA